MPSTKVRLAVFAALAVALVMTAATIAFNLFLGWKIQSDAIRDIEYALDWNTEDAGTGRVPNYLFLNSSLQINPEERFWSAQEEVDLAAWFAQHPTEGVVSQVTINNWTCYAALVSSEDYVFEYDRSDDGTFNPGSSNDEEIDTAYLVAYIDITGEQALTTSVNITFAIITLVGIIAAAFAGYIAGRRIDEAQDAQKRFYENMSHELKTPLAAIRGYAEGVEAGVVDDKSAMLAIQNETSKMANLIDEILGLSRLEAGAVRVNRESIEVSDFIQDCLMPFEGAVRTKGLNVSLDLKSGAVEADRDLFEHALTNVLSNAVRHASSEIRIAYNGTAITVKNDGSLPTSDQLEHFFDRFYVGDGGSTGVGLAIAREIAAMHGWNIGARIQDCYLVITINLT